jgi:hypothetical protein
MLHSTIGNSFALLVLLNALLPVQPARAQEPERAAPRLAVLTDIGGDPDDTQSLVRLMVYANQFRIEALIASASGTPGELKQAVTRPDLIRQVIEAYRQVRPNLQRHEDGWPSADRLLSVVTSGNPRRGRKSIGKGNDTDGARRLLKLIEKGTADDPLNITIWGGQTDFAQAMWMAENQRDEAGWKTFVSKFRVYDIADQDKIAGWIAAEFPGLFYILSKSPAGTDKRRAVFRGMYLTGDESLTSRRWVQENILSTGPLGKLYPLSTWTAPNPHKCIKEGDTPSWFFFLRRGGNDPGDPTQPGWGGRYVQAKDGWFRDPAVAKGFDPRTTVSRWRPAFQADFAKRMRWCQRSGSI